MDQQNLRNPDSTDTTPTGWIIFLWLCGFLIPGIGMWIVIIISSLLYYAWKDVAPNKARAINRNGWIIFILSLILNMLFASFFFLGNVC